LQANQSVAEVKQGIRDYSIWIAGFRFVVPVDSRDAVHALPTRYMFGVPV
jgi:hypothetical protein